MTFEMVANSRDVILTMFRAIFFEMFVLCVTFKIPQRISNNQERLVGSNARNLESTVRNDYVLQFKSSIYFFLFSRIQHQKRMSMKQIIRILRFHLKVLMI
jgi:hypothetical protein